MSIDAAVRAYQQRLIAHGHSAEAAADLASHVRGTQLLDAAGHVDAAKVEDLAALTSRFTGRRDRSGRYRSPGSAGRAEAERRFGTRAPDTPSGTEPAAPAGSAGRAEAARRFGPGGAS